MATITTAKAGNFSDTTVWTGGVLPGIGDTMKLTYQVTLDVSASIGGIDPTSSASLIGKNSQFQLLVGGTGLLYVAKALVL